MNELSIETKAAAFDALCKIVGRPKVAENTYVMGRPIIDRDGNITHSRREIAVYEWRLRADNCDDFIAACLALLPKDA